MSLSFKKYKNPIPTVDAIIHNNLNRILLVKRKRDPYKGYLALPGGFINHGETVEDAVKREVLEETSLNVEPLEILGVYSDPSRDPRDHIISTVFVCLKLDDSDGKAGDDASDLSWIDLNKVSDQSLAFDHKQILNDYSKWRIHNSTFWSTKKR